MKLGPILFRKLLQLMLTLTVLVLFSCGGDGLDSGEAVDGVIDLRDKDLANGKPVGLDGEWRFFWKDTTASTKAAPSSSITRIQVPDAWNGYRIGDEKIKGKGVGVYDLTILLPQRMTHYALSFPTVGTAYVLHVNDQLIGGVGIASEDPDLARAEYKTVVYDIGSHAGQLSVRLEVSNYHHRLGGLWESISLGNINKVYEERERSIAMQLFLFGMLFIMGVYHLGIFSLSTKGNGALYFGVFCLLIAIRALATGPLFLLNIWPSLSWNSLVRIEYLTFYLGIPFFFQFISNQFPFEISKKSKIVVIIVSGVFSATVLFTSPAIFTSTLVYYQLFSLAVMIYTVYALGLALVRGEEGSALILLGFLIIMLTFINDVLYAHHFFQTGYFISLGLMVFILTQALLISIRFSKAYKTIDSQRTKLERTNSAYQSEIEIRKAAEEEVLKHKENLEDLVEARTEELQIANERLEELSRVDGLTGIANRRHLDEELEREWRRMLRQEKHLSVIMCDIDHFKLYNDTYGHQQGDVCLAKVAKAIKNSINRPADLVARYGGEEFCLVLPETTQEGAAILAEIVRENVKYLQIEHRSSPASKLVTLSLGVASMIPDRNSKPSVLLEAADRALYQAKGNGRDRVEVNLQESV
jgi:diguanylate cyclase (GGDEF)-like protein